MSTFAIVVCSVLRYDWQWSQANRTQCRFAGTLYSAVHDRVAKNRRRFFFLKKFYYGKAMFGRLYCHVNPKEGGGQPYPETPFLLPV